MRRIYLAAVAFIVVTVASAQPHFKLRDDIYIRDPHILPVEKEGVYYMYGSSSVNHEGQTYGGVVAYKSRDLKNWTGPYGWRMEFHT